MSPVSRLRYRSRSLDRVQNYPNSTTDGSTERPGAVFRGPRGYRLHSPLPPFIVGSRVAAGSPKHQTPVRSWSLWGLGGEGGGGRVMAAHNRPRFSRTTHGMSHDGNLHARRMAPGEPVEPFDLKSGTYRDMPEPWGQTRD